MKIIRFNASQIVAILKGWVYSIIAIVNYYCKNNFACFLFVRKIHSRYRTPLFCRPCNHLITFSVRVSSRASPVFRRVTGMRYRLLEKSNLSQSASNSSIFRQTGTSKSFTASSLSRPNLVPCFLHGPE